MSRTKATRRAAADRSVQDALPEISEWTDRKASRLAQRASQARQVSGRRPRIDPATCDRDYSAAEMEFMQAMQEYKRKSGRLFPTWSEILEVLHGLGYQKVGQDGTSTPTSAC